MHCFPPYSTYPAKPVERHHSYCLQLLLVRFAKLTFLLGLRILSLPDPVTHYPSATPSYDILVPGIADHGASDTPEPLFARILCGCCCLHHYRQILTSGEEILGLRSSTPAISKHRQHRRHPQRHRRHRRRMVCRIWNALCDNG